MFIKIAFALLLPVLARATPVLDKRNTVLNTLIYAQRDNLCLSVATGRAANDLQANTAGTNGKDLYDGLAVVSLPCEQASVWDLKEYGSDAIYVSNANKTFVLDAGDFPENDGPLKVSKRLTGAGSQEWWHTGDKRIAITGGTQCLTQGDKGAETEQCETGNNNQVWEYQLPSPHNDPSPLRSLAVPAAAATSAAIAGGSASAGVTITATSPAALAASPSASENSSSTSSPASSSISSSDSGSSTSSSPMESSVDGTDSSSSGYTSVAAAATSSSVATTSNTTTAEAAADLSPADTVSSSSDSPSPSVVTSAAAVPTSSPTDATSTDRATTNSAFIPAVNNAVTSGSAGGGMPAASSGFSNATTPTSGAADGAGGGSCKRTQFKS
ncbi:hypothetical protein IAR55_000669 [Kwoniella newhampshirensis]|uniref:Ricin B lectin domain-containing protein n=1 Tax=Kwoniella newhampshirensis TaxID=1651941 RepID=A0AAW0Z7G9_9TREE